MYNLFKQSNVHYSSDNYIKLDVSDMTFKGIVDFYTEKIHNRFTCSHNLSRFNMSENYDVYCAKCEHSYQCRNCYMCVDDITRNDSIKRETICSVCKRVVILHYCKDCLCLTNICNCDLSQDAL